MGQQRGRASGDSRSASGAGRTAAGGTGQSRADGRLGAGTQQKAGQQAAGFGGGRAGSAGRRSGERAAPARAASERAPRPAYRPVDVGRLRAVVAPVVEAAGYDLEDLTVQRMGQRHVLRLAVDSDQGVDLDRVADVSRAVSAALDDAERAGGELIAGEYELEVGSPGVDRPLTAPRHWRRNQGRLVQVRAGGKQVTGRVTAVDADAVTLDVDGVAHRFGHGELGAGRVQVEFTRPGRDVSGDVDDLDDLDDFDDAGDFDDADVAELDGPHGVRGSDDEGEEDR